MAKIKEKPVSVEVEEEIVKEKKNYYMTPEEKLEKINATIEKTETEYKERMAKLKVRKKALELKVKKKKTAYDKKFFASLGEIVAQANGNLDEETVVRLQQAYEQQKK